MSSFPLRCRCGALQGSVADLQNVNHAVCYCRDCQAFAHYLGNIGAILDARGGSEIVQIPPKNLSFERGSEQLACIRLTPKGLLRWYARCCRTPVGNTLATPKLAFIGLLHSCLDGDARALERAFGPVSAWVHTDGARGEPKPKAQGLARSVWWFAGTAIKARLTGEFRRTPLFRADTGAPIVVPHVLSPEEHARVMDAVRAARI
jgi:hypothetical protein